MLWEVLYMQLIDKNENVMTGTGENPENYVESSKRTYLYLHIAYIAVFAALWSYFIYVVNHYNGLYPEKPKKEEEKKDEEKKADDAKKDWWSIGEKTYKFI